MGEGLGVRAKKRANPAHSELKRCTLISCVPLSREAGEGETQGAPPFTPTPLSREAGEGEPQGAPPCALHPSPTQWERGWG